MTDPTKIEGQVTRDPITGGLMTVANKATNERTAPVKPPSVIPGALAGILGLLTLLAGAPAAAVAAILAAKGVPPPWLITAAAIGTPVGGVLAAGAYWAAGGNPLQLLATFAPKVPGVASTDEKPPDSTGTKGPNP